MAAVIGSLRAILGLDSAEFTSGLKKANAGLNGFVRGASVGFAAVAAAATTAGVAMGVAVKGAIDNADRMGEMAQRVGLSVEALTSLGYAAKLSGSDTESLATSVQKLSQNMLAVAQGGTGPAATAFKALGISVQEADGRLRASDAVLLDVADKFARMEDGATKTALAVQLFGRSGAELIPFLNQGSAGISALTDEADRLGITISGSTANAAGQFNDTIDRLQATFQGVVNQVAGAVLPSLNELGAKLSDPQFAASAQAIGVAIVDAMKIAVDSINTVVGAFSALQGAMSWMNGHDMLGRPIEGNGSNKAFLKFNTVDEAKALITEQLAAGKDQPTGDVYAGIFGAPAAQVAAEAQAVADAFVPVIQNTQAAGAAASELKSIMAEGQAVFTATRTPAEAYSIEVERLNSLLQKGAIDQDTYNRAVTQAQDAFKSAETSGNQLASTLSNSLANVFGAVIDGSKTAAQAVDDLIKSFAKMGFQEGFKALFGGLFGGFGGGGGKGGGFLGGLFGFANGGSFQVGGAGGIDSQLVAFKASPNETVSVTKPGQERSGGMNVRISLDNELLRAVVTDEAGRVVGEAAPSMIGTAVGQSSKLAPSAVARYQQQRAGGDYRLD